MEDVQEKEFLSSLSPTNLFSVGTDSTMTTEAIQRVNLSPESSLSRRLRNIPEKEIRAQGWKGWVGEGMKVSLLDTTPVRTAGMLVPTKHQIHTYLTYIPA